ncbi:hypothetical protein D1BOALGB6SA_7214 [Olavius sp. associated proteobacterium Delta 1]|nr:hypothetical protein D1BOALGB6SA_7214 [Olavius sp. associated proteobacterium Delta 1]
MQLDSDAYSTSRRPNFSLIFLPNLVKFENHLTGVKKSAKN